MAINQITVISTVSNSKGRHNILSNKSSWKAFLEGRKEHIQAKSSRLSELGSRCLTLIILDIDKVFIDKNLKIAKNLILLNTPLQVPTFFAEMTKLVVKYQASNQIDDQLLTDLSIYNVSRLRRHLNRNFLI